VSSAGLEAPPGEPDRFGLERHGRRGRPHAVPPGPAGWWWRVQGCIAPPPSGDRRRPPSRVMRTSTRSQFQPWLSWWFADYRMSSFAVFAQGETRKPLLEQRKARLDQGSRRATLHAASPRLPQKPTRPSPQARSAAIGLGRLLANRRALLQLGEWQGVGGKGKLVGRTGDRELQSGGRVKGKQARLGSPWARSECPGKRFVYEATL